MGTLQHDPPVLPWTPQSHQQQAPHSADASTNPGSGGTWETDPGPTDVEASDSEPPGSEEHPIETDPTEEAAASSSNAEGKRPAFAKRLF